MECERYFRGVSDTRLGLRELHKLVGNVIGGAEVRESIQYIGGKYLFVVEGEVEFTFEKVDEEGYIVRADFQNGDAIGPATEKLSSVLRAKDIAHKFEIYGGDDVLERCLSHPI